MRITRLQAEALATFIARIRTDWDHPGIVAAIQKAADASTPAEIGVALCRLAGNPDLRTPAALAGPGTHWQGTVTGQRPAPLMCDVHPDERTPPFCRKCEIELAQVAHAAHAARLREALKGRPRCTDTRQPIPERVSLDAARRTIDTQEQP